MTTRLSTAALVLLGVACQMLQHADETFFLLYFTVHSALLGGAASLALASRWGSPAWESSRDASCVGLLVSSAVYTTAILPRMGLERSDGLLAWAATIILHGAVPALVLLDYLLSPRLRPVEFTDALLRWLPLPLNYLCFVALLSWTGVALPPYAFLLPSEVGWLGVVVSCAAATALFLALGVGLVAARRKADSVRGSRPHLTS